MLLARVQPVHPVAKRLKFQVESSHDSGMALQATDDRLRPLVEFRKESRLDPLHTGRHALFTGSDTAIDLLRNPLLIVLRQHTLIIQGRR